MTAPVRPRCLRRALHRLLGRCATWAEDEMASRRSDWRAAVVHAGTTGANRTAPLSLLTQAQDCRVSCWPEQPLRPPSSSVLGRS